MKAAFADAKAKTVLNAPAAAQRRHQAGGIGDDATHINKRATGCGLATSTSGNASTQLI